MSGPVETPTLAACRQQCELPVQRLRLVADDLRAEMRAGLAADGCALKMLPTYVTRLPSGCVPTSLVEWQCSWAT
jgi:hexokinase